MPNYKYRVIFEDGKLGRGKITAQSRVQAIDMLKKNNIQPIMVERMHEVKQKKYKRLDYSKLAKSISVEQKNRYKSSKDLNNINGMKRTGIDFTYLFKIKTKDIITFSNNFYILKKAKFTNSQALKTIYDGLENKAFKEIIEEILIGVEAGEKIYAVMANYPQAFPPMYVNFVRVGEESGTLDTALLYARDYIETSANLKKKVRSAILPRVLQFFGIIIAMFAALIIGVPLIEEVYKMFDSNEEIPVATQIGLSVAKWTVANWYIPVGILVIIGVLFYMYYSTPKGRYTVDKIIITMPVIGKLYNNITVNKFFQAMLLNIKNGMRIQESLEVSKNVTNNYYFLSAIETGKINSLAGNSWIEPFEEKNLFTPMVSEMVDVGMQTDLSEMMEKVNEYIKIEIDEALALFVKWLPEVTYLFVGIALIALVITVVVPITNVYMGTFINI